MTLEEFNELLDKIQNMKCETKNIELKAASEGCPKRLYDTLSSFSNQDDGGIIVFGVDETKGYEEVGVYDSQDIQKKINEQCHQMEPVVRPLITVIERNNKFFVAAEIPGLDITSRPCYYKGKGRVKGSYLRIGDSDEPMSEYEVYSYEAFLKKYQDEKRTIDELGFNDLNQDKIATYLTKVKMNKANTSKLDDSKILNLMGLTVDGIYTLASNLLFGLYPQIFKPMLSINAVVVPGNKMGVVGASGERFVDNKRIEGTLDEMLNLAIEFVRKNIKVKTIIDPVTLMRNDKPEYPLEAVREALLNALVHRDYSIYTERMPVTLTIYDNRIEINNPGGLYGSIGINELGKVHPETRNPIIATTLEILGVTENRYSGIPTIKEYMKEYNLSEPVFIDDNKSFTVILYNGEYEEQVETHKGDLLDFLEEPRSREEICEFLRLTSKTYVYTKYIQPLINKGIVGMTIKDKPSSSKQKFYLINK